MSSVKGYLLVFSALVFCPCHLPILAAVLAGTALGASIIDYQGLLFPLMALYFIGALFTGLRWMTREDPTECPSCEPEPTESHVEEPVEEKQAQEPNVEPTRVASLPR
jgi:mercuric ion transport protein